MACIALLAMLIFTLFFSGFLHLDSSILPGNLGLIDQVEAIKWVHRNIKCFNGDPNTVTLAGHSAGAADVGIHLLNPNTEGMA